MEKLLNNIKLFFTQYPEYIYFIIGIIFCVLFIGALKDKNGLLIRKVVIKDFYIISLDIKHLGLVSREYIYLDLLQVLVDFYYIYVDRVYEKNKLKMIHTI